MDSGGYAIADVDSIPVLRMAEIEAVPEKFDELGVTNLDTEALDTESMAVKLWHIPPGQSMGVHGHDTQEEFYYVLEGQFRVDIGSPGATDTHEVGPGTVFAAGPTIGRGYENIGETEGRILVVAAPNVEDSGIPESELQS